MKSKLLIWDLIVCFLIALLPSSVLAADDYDPPVITGVYMNSPGAIVKAGDTLNFEIAVTDESELDQASISFHSDRYSHILSTYSWLRIDRSAYNIETGILSLTLTIDDSALDGVYTIFQIRVSDYYKNESIIDSDHNPENVELDGVSFTVTSGGSDNSRPQITGVYMGNPGAVVTVGDTLNFDIAVTDESELDHASIVFRSIDSNGNIHTYPRGYGSEMTVPDSYNAETGILSWSFTIDDRALDGVYTIEGLNVIDHYGNSSEVGTFFNPDNIDLDGVYFTVAGGGRDFLSPKITDVHMSDPGAAVTVGDTLDFDIAVTDESELYATITFHSTDSYGNSHSLFGSGYSYNAETGILNATLKIDDSVLDGVYTIEDISVSDYYNNRSQIDTDHNPNNIDLDSISFIVASPDNLPTAVSFPSQITIPERSVYTISPDVTPITSIPRWTISTGDSSIATATITGNGSAINVTGVAPGTTTITGTTSNGLATSCEVTVLDAPLPTNVQIEKEYHVDIGKTLDIVPVLTPVDATSLYEITTDNPHVVSVDPIGGQAGIRIKGVNAGNATITIRTSNNLIATAIITVGTENNQQHEKTTIPAVKPTCMNPGYTESVVCSACQYVFIERQEIPALGHDYGEWVIVRNSTGTQDGLKKRICRRCGDEITENIPAAGETSSPEPFDSTDNPAPVDESEKRIQITADGQSIAATVSGNMAEIDIPSDMTPVIDRAAVDSVLNLDVSSYKDISSVSVPRLFVDAINESDSVERLSISTVRGTVSFSGDALESIAETFTGNNDSIMLSVENIDLSSIPSTQKYPITSVMNRAVFVSLSASVIHKDASGNVTSTEQFREFGGDVTVSLPYTPHAGMVGREIIACYIADDGSISFFPATYESGVVTFRTTHFSYFGVFASKAAAFSDVDITAWYMPALEYASNCGLINGFGDGTIAPEKELSRAMLVQILYNKEGKPGVAGTSSFSDVVSTDWYYDAVKWAERAGITVGDENERFLGNVDITREQLVTMLWRYAGQPKSAHDLSVFTDADSISGYAQEAFGWAMENGIIQGMGDNTIRPTSTATRAQTAQIFLNLTY